MIVTRNGRRLFPVFKVKIDGLDANEMYQIELDFLLNSPHRYKYVGGEWLKNNRTDAVSSGGSYVHPDSPNFGGYWNHSPVSFSRVKITNREPTSPGAVLIFLIRFYYIQCINTHRV